MCWAPPLALAFASLAAPLAAQEQGLALQPHLRADAILAREAAGHLAAGLSLPVARYVRVDLTVGGGIGERPAGGTRGAGRADLLGRFVLDPEFTREWAMYGAAGVGVIAAGGTTRELLLVALGAEGPRWGGAVPFAEVGLGGGIRLGVGVRRARAGQR